MGWRDNAFGPKEVWGYTDEYALRQMADNSGFQIADYIDMNGDGLPDRVMKGKESSDLLIWFNQCTAADKLSKVYTAGGGEIEYKYKALDKSQNRGMKTSLWVVDEIMITDGMTDSRAMSIVTEYDYKRFSPQFKM